MSSEYYIQRGNQIGNNVVLVVEDDNSAYTPDFDLEIEWGFGDAAQSKYGVGEVDNQERAFVDHDGRWWHATPIDGDGETISSDLDPFIALAQLAYIENW